MVYLHTVRNATHPLRVASGSHRTLFYSYDTPAEVHFTNQYVEAGYKVETFTGDLGDGVCWDTNTVHSGTIEGDEQRDVLMFMFHRSSKIRALAEAEAQWPDLRRSHGGC